MEAAEWKTGNPLTVGVAVPLPFCARSVLPQRVFYQREVHTASQICTGVEFPRVQDPRHQTSLENTDSGFSFPRPWSKKGGEGYATKALRTWEAICHLSHT